MHLVTYMRDLIKWSYAKVKWKRNTETAWRELNLRPLLGSLLGVVPLLFNPYKLNFSF